MVDANILFSALIGGTMTSLLFNARGLRFCAPAHLFEEFAVYKEELLRKTHRSPPDFFALFHELRARIEIVPPERTAPLLPVATALSSDPKDVPYLAAALLLRAPIWSNDKRLKAQKAVPVLSTQDLLALLGQEPSF